MEHVEVFREDGRFGGWPANYGMWGFDGGRELVCCYTVVRIRRPTPPPPRPSP
eukprot:COSAG04_NODE_3762_length_2553_cov_1.007746_2_plen_53_part_00